MRQFLLLDPLRLSKPLARHHPLVLELDLVAIPRELVALFRPRPEAVHCEAVVEIGAEVEHDADWEHDVHAELWEFSLEACACWDNRVAHLEYL